MRRSWLKYFKLLLYWRTFAVIAVINSPLQADKVRQLKANGVPKDTLDAEVKILKELKAKLGVAEPPKEQKAGSGSKGKKKWTYWMDYIVAKIVRFLFLLGDNVMYFGN